MLGGRASILSDKRWVVCTKKIRWWWSWEVVLMSACMSTYIHAHIQYFRTHIRFKLMFILCLGWLVGWIFFGCGCSCGEILTLYRGRTFVSTNATSASRGPLAAQPKMRIKKTELKVLDGVGDINKWIFNTHLHHIGLLLQTVVETNREWALNIRATWFGKVVDGDKRWGKWSHTSHPTSTKTSLVIT